MPRKQIRTLMLSLAAGVAAATLFDPRAGRRRRALIADKCRHLARVTPRRLARVGRGFTGPARGIAHRLGALLPWRKARPEIDGTELVHRVQSELGRHGDLPLNELNFDAADGLLRIRGTIEAAETAARIVGMAAEINGVRTVISLMRTPDGTPAGGMAGDLSVLDTGPRAEVEGEAVLLALKQRWPQVTDADILASDGYLARLAALISMRTGEPDATVRSALDESLLAAIPA